jgi:ABC-type phosphate transport system substrate-binding protein
MNKSNKRTIRSTCVVFGLLLPQLAGAQDCPNLEGSTVIAGSTAALTLIRELSKILAASNTSDSPPLVYAGLGSCAGVELMVLGASVPSETVTYWDGAGSEKSCTPSAPIDANIAISDVFPSSCLALPNGLPSNIADFLGPVQSMVFAVPRASTQRTISAEAAYFVYGFGSESGVEPWISTDFIFQRSADSGTQAMVAAAIAVPSAQWRGTSTSGSSDMLEKLLSVPAQQADSAIGILSSSHLEQNRATLRALAYQHFGSSCAVLPNRTASSHEKANVRDGSYAIWGPLHMLTTVDADRRPTNENVEALIGYIVGTREPPGGLDLVALQAEEQLIPQCAMRVTRTTELGPASPFVPERPCGCAYEEAANGVTECKSCQTSAQCANQETCVLGYCESP